MRRAVSKSLSFDLAPKCIMRSVKARLEKAPGIFSTFKCWCLSDIPKLKSFIAACDARLIEIPVLITSSANLSVTCERKRFRQLIASCSAIRRGKPGSRAWCCKCVFLISHMNCNVLLPAYKIASNSVVSQLSNQ